MQPDLHANAPRMRAHIQSSTAPVAEVGVSDRTVRCWRGRSTTADRSHWPKRMAIMHRRLREDRLLLENALTIIAVTRGAAVISPVAGAAASP